MILSAQTAYSILTYIASAGTIYDEIINNMIEPNFHLKPELISEIAISFLGNQDKVNEVIKNGYFNYYFIMTVKNQVHSKTSSFHKINRMTKGVFNEPIETFAMNMDDGSIQDKEEQEIKEKQLQLLEEILNDTKVTWFEKEIYDLYFHKGYSYRQIEEETGIDHCLAWTKIKNIKNRIKKQMNNSDIY